MSKSKQPKSKSYEKFLQEVDDSFTSIKLTFFSYLTGITEPYLKKYQSDKPMVPYVYADLKALVKSLLQIIVKHEEIEKCKTSPQLKDLGLTNGSAFHLKNMQMGFGVEENLRKLKSKDAVTHQ